MTNWPKSIDRRLCDDNTSLKWVKLEYPQMNQASILTTRCSAYHYIEVPFWNKIVLVPILLYKHIHALITCKNKQTLDPAEI